MVVVGEEGDDDDDENDDGALWPNQHPPLVPPIAPSTALPPATSPACLSARPLSPSISLLFSPRVSEHVYILFLLSYPPLVIPISKLAFPLELSTQQKFLMLSSVPRWCHACSKEPCGLHHAARGTMQWASSGIRRMLSGSRAPKLSSKTNYHRLTDRSSFRKRLKTKLQAEEVLTICILKSSRNVKSGWQVGKL